MLGSPILYLKAMRILMFQLSGFYCKAKAVLDRCYKRFGGWFRGCHLEGRVGIV